MTQATARAERRAVSFLSTAVALTTRGGLPDRPATSTPRGSDPSALSTRRAGVRRFLSPTFFSTKSTDVEGVQRGGMSPRHEAAGARRWTGYPPNPLKPKENHP
jgi:hypothetical protein